jgi:hypothetical protein
MPAILGLSDSKTSPRPKQKVFGTDANLWATYHAKLAFRDKLVGGVPKDPRLIEGWLRTRAGIEDPQELRLAVLRSLSEVAANGDGASPDELDEVATAVVAQKRTTGFKCEPQHGLYVEGRQIKAMLKESTNIVFAGERWGPTRKAARSFFAERVFVDPDRVSLGVAEPSGVETVIGHISGPTGPRSTLSNYEYVVEPVIAFRVLVLRDCIAAEQWRDIWCLAQENGLGTLRSQGYGRFDVIEWERMT